MKIKRKRESHVYAHALTQKAFSMDEGKLENVMDIG